MNLEEKQRVYQLVKELIALLGMGEWEKGREVCHKLSQLCWEGEWQSWQDFWQDFLSSPASPLWQEFASLVLEYWEKAAQGVESLPSPEEVVTSLKGKLHQWHPREISPPQVSSEPTLEKEDSLEAKLLQFSLLLLDQGDQKLHKLWAEFLSTFRPSFQWREGLLFQCPGWQYVIPKSKGGLLCLHTQELSVQEAFDLRSLWESSSLKTYWVEKITQKGRSFWICPGKPQGIHWYVSLALPPPLSKPYLRRYALLGTGKLAWEIQQE